MHYEQLSNLNWLWWVALVVAVIIVAMVRHHRALAAFASPELRNKIVATNWSGKAMSLVLTALALVGIVLGLVDIRWGRVWREVPQRGIEVMFVLDVSRSMLAQDTSPNRLERSKQYVKDMIQEMAGDRVGLVLFAGDVKKQVPLTNHYGDFFSSLEEVGPHNIDRGGSNLGDAIEVAADAFLEKTSEHRAIVLFTDGEYHESEPVDAAKKALAENGTRIFTVGIGNSDAGARIPEQQRGRSSQYLKHDGQMVLSKRNDGILEKIALATDGAYIPAGTKHVDMAAVYHQFIANIEQKDFETARVNTYFARYQWFLGFALLMLLAEIFVSTMRRRKEKNVTTEFAAGRVSSEEKVAERRLSTSAAMVVVVMLLFVWSNQTLAQGSPEGGSPAVESSQEISAAQLVQQGQGSLKLGDAAAALKSFDTAKELGFADPRLSYNKGIAQYNLGEMTAARESFADAASSRDLQLAGQARFNLGNTFYAEAMQGMEQDPAAAIASLQNAIGHYRGALNCDPSDQDARANIELADRLKRQLQKQQEQQPESQQQQDQDQQQEGDSQDSEQNESEQEQQGDENEDTKEGDQEQEGDKSDGQQDQKPSSEGQENEKPGEDQQSSESGDSESSESDGAETENGKPPTDGDLEAINDTEQETASGSEGKEGPPMTMQEARKLLQAVRDREFRGRIQEMRRMRSRRIAVEKDW